WPTLIRAMVVSNIVLDLLDDKPLAVTLGLCIANAVAVIGSALRLRRLFGQNITLRRINEVVGFLVIAVFAACACSGVIAGLTFTLAGVKASFLNSAVIWFVGDAMGVLLLVPVILT